MTDWPPANAAEEVQGLHRWIGLANFQLRFKVIHVMRSSASGGRLAMNRLRTTDGRPSLHVEATNGSDGAVVSIALCMVISLEGVACRPK